MDGKTHKLSDSLPELLVTTRNFPAIVLQNIDENSTIFSSIMPVKRITKQV